MKDASDIKSYIEEREAMRVQCIGLIVQLEDNLKTIDSNINGAKAILRQIEVEEIQELNPKAKVYYL